jgi:Carbohydrate-binding module 48 (Isoamylase N-terminal domain)
MSDEQLSHELERAIRHLRRPVEVSPEAKARLLAAVAADKIAREPTAAGRAFPRPWLQWTAAVAAGIALATAIALAVARRPVAPGHANGSPPGEAPATPSRPAASGSADTRGAARPHRFTVRVAEGERVALVGDFNGWNPRATPMRRDAATGRWIADVMLRPGRYAYALVVNDSVWHADPDAARAAPDELGVSRSILVVDSLPR